MGGPDPGPGQAEHWGEGGAAAVLLAEQDDGGVRGGVEEEGDELIGRTTQGSLDGWQEVGVVGEEVHAVGEGDGHGGGKGRAGASEKVLQVSPGGHAGGEAAGTGQAVPVPPKPVCLVPT